MFQGKKLLLRSSLFCGPLLKAPLNHGHLFLPNTVAVVRDEGEQARERGRAEYPEPQRNGTGHERESLDYINGNRRGE